MGEYHNNFLNKFEPHVTPGVLQNWFRNEVVCETEPYAICVCGPFSAMSNYKYRVKVTPGTMKKGKSVQQCVSSFKGNRDGTTREVDLIEAIPHTEMLQAMVPDATLHGSGIGKSGKGGKGKGKGKKGGGGGGGGGGKGKGKGGKGGKKGKK